jgi:SAM-dependent methyltransferase
MNEADEAQAVRARYARRLSQNPRQDPRYSLLNPAALCAFQERQRALMRLFKRLGWLDLCEIKVLEVGCGHGGNLQELLRLGFAPENLKGIELLPERFAAARAALPTAVHLYEGDALALDLSDESFDVVYVSTVFSSLLNDAFQAQLAAAMWRWAKPGGGVLWYDFTYNNPRNPDVRGVPIARVRELFPHGHLHANRITLAPPIARAVTQLHPALYGVFNMLPLLRTHVLAWVGR